MKTTQNDLIMAYEALLSHVGAFGPETELEREVLIAVLDYLEGEVSYIKDIEENHANE